MGKEFTPGLISRALALVSPRLALQREFYRQGLRQFYSAAKTGRATDGWTTVAAGAETTNRGSRDIIRARARDLERNSDVMGGLIHPIVSNVVGSGYQLQAKVLRADGSEDEAFNTQVEEKWKKWCRPQSCDIRGLHSLSEMLELIVRRRLVDGGVLVLKISSKNRFCLQVVEVDRLDTSVTTFTPPGAETPNRVEGGIEVDAYSRPVAYHLRGNTDTADMGSRRVPAKDVIYLPVLTRAEQVREMSPLCSSLSRIDDINEFIAAALRKEEILSYLGVFVTNSVPGGGFGRGFAPAGGPKGKQELALEQGMITYLAPGEDVKTINPAGVSASSGEMLRTTQRLTGSGQGLSYEAASRDMSQVNYSSARQGLLEDRKTYSSWQTYLIDHLLTPVYEEWLDWMLLSGQLPISPQEYAKNPEAYQRHVWVRPGWDWIDPLKEANANRVALDTCQTTLQEICASKGKDWRDIIAQRKVEMEALGNLGGDGPS
mgnify:CR=1 FL=1